MTADHVIDIIEQIWIPAYPAGSPEDVALRKVVANLRATVQALRRPCPTCFAKEPCAATLCEHPDAPPMATRVGGPMRGNVPRSS